MKRLLLATALALPSLAFAQGALTPSTAPAPSMKSLDQIEPRYIVEPGRYGVTRDAAGALHIEDPGSYYLASDLIVRSGTALIIEASNVTLDLGGFMIKSESASGSGMGIEIAQGAINVVIRHGRIVGGTLRQAAGTYAGGGFVDGIAAVWPGNTTVQGSLVVEDVAVEGMAGHGIILSSIDSTIRRCTAGHCGSTGLIAWQVLASSTNNCYSGLQAFRHVCDSYAHGDTYGIMAIGGSVQNCHGYGGSGPGVSAQTIAHSVGISTTGPGLVATTVADSSGESTDSFGVTTTVATGSFGTSTNSTGLNAATATNCYGYSYNGWGLYATEATNCHGKSENGTRGLHAENTATGCTGEIVNATGPASRSATQGSIPMGLRALNAQNCAGTIGTGSFDGSTPQAGTATGVCYGLKAITAGNCRGTIWATETPYAGDRGAGLFAGNVANSYGLGGSGYGIECYVAANSFGTSTATDGINALGTASFCFGSSSGSSAITARIAVACTSGGGPITATSKQLGTP